jgi:hypothetical protein
MRKIIFLFSLISFNACAVIDLNRLDPDKTIPPELLKKSYDYYVANLKKIKNKRYVGIINFKEHNSRERLFLVDMESGLVEKYLVAHGKNSDPKFTGFATEFSNTIDSWKSSLGFYLTAETYEGQHGYSLRLDGLSSTNSNARERAIVMHGADYVQPGTKIGRSFGCPAVEIRYHQQVINLLKEGALLYASYE